MQRARGLEHNPQSAQDRGASGPAPRSEPLTLVAGAVAGDDLRSVAGAVSRALRCPVAIAIPALGEPVVHPAGSLSSDAASAVAAHAAAVIDGVTPALPPALAEAVAVQIGEQIVGIVAAVVGGADGGELATPEVDLHAWLQAAAAAASVTALIREADGAPPESAGALLEELVAGRPDDLPAFLARARRHGLDLGGGAVALSVRAGGGVDPTLAEDLRERLGALAAELEPGAVLALVPLGAAADREAAQLVAGELRERGMTVAVSAPRRDPRLLHDAVLEARLLTELDDGAAEPAGQDETYRLLIGVLLRDPDEVARLRERTISPLVDYDAGHDTELLATLRAFLAHDGSTTETAEAMKLHRHTVGYRLSRLHEVSGLSPYESGGRERLSLGLKAHDILAARRRLAGPPAQR
jgi:hypothetical protein